MNIDNGTRAVLAQAFADLAGKEAKPLDEIVYLGHPALSTPTRLVETDEEWQFVRAALLPALHSAVGKAWVLGVGLAANQIGADLRVAIAKLRGEWVEMVNPRIIEVSPVRELKTQEGCLSVPHFRTSRMRYQWVVVDWTDATGCSRERKKFSDYDAQIVQHEIDHLDGKTLCFGTTRQQRRQAERALADYLEKKR